MDLWAQIYLLDGGERLGRTITEYRNTYFCAGKRNATTIFQYDLLPGADELIRDRIRDICISLPSENDIPRIDDVRYVKLDSKAQKAYTEMEKQRILEFGDTTLDAGSAAVLSNKLLQLANGAVYNYRQEVQLDGSMKEVQEVIEVHDNKIEAFMELVEALNGEHALVFYNFQHDRDRIIKVLKRSGLKIGELKTREDISKWNSGEMDILLAHPASAAYGLNLQDGGHHVIWFGLNWSLELYQQANARLLRQGQLQTVYVHMLVVAGSVDEDVMNALERKDESQAALLVALKARIDKYKAS